jgi:hypothetical protein
MDLGKFVKERTITREPAQQPQRIAQPATPAKERELQPA